MSDCRVPMPFYQPPDVRERDQGKPIRGRLVFDDGTERKLSLARYVNGRERRVVAVELDGVTYAPVVRDEDLDWMGD